jgi:hypothetical protein
MSLTPLRINRNPPIIDGARRCLTKGKVGFISGVKVTSGASEIVRMLHSLLQGNWHSNVPQPLVGLRLQSSAIIWRMPSSRIASGSGQMRD